MKIKLFLFLAVFSNCLASTDYINKYFPKDSYIRKMHNSEPHGTSWFGFDSTIRASCDHLNTLFSQLEKRTPDDYSHWYLFVYDSLAGTVRNIMDNQDEKAIQAELDWTYELKNLLDKKAEKNYKKSDIYQEELKQKSERDQKLHAIRTALEQKDRN